MRMKYTRIFLFTMCCFLLSFCTTLKDGKSTIKQGVFGRVLWVEGNMMPSPDRPQAKEGTPVVRTVYIYELTKLGDTEGEAPLFSGVKSKLIAKVATNKAGYYQCELAPGRYSIFTGEEGGQFFASLFEGDGAIASFEVKQGEVLTYPIQVNYKAAY
jgi:hypothetical protein